MTPCVKKTAALDVPPQGLPNRVNPVLSHARVPLSPLLTYYSELSEEQPRPRAIENIVAWHYTETPTNVVDAGGNSR